MENDTVQISLADAFGTSLMITGTATAVEEGLRLDYRITPKLMALARRGLADTTVPWEDILELNVEKRLTHYRLHIRTRSVDPLTGQDRPHETQIWFRLLKQEWEAAERIALGLVDWRRRQAEPELQNQIDEIWDFIHDL